MKIGLNIGKKDFLGLLIVAVLVFMCSCLLFGSGIVSSNVAYAASVEVPVIEVQPIGYSGNYNAALQDLFVEASHSDDTVTLIYGWYAKLAGQSSFVSVGDESTYPINGVNDNGSYYCIIVAKDTDNDTSEEVVTDTVVVDIFKVVVYATINNAESFYGEAVSSLSYDITSGELVNGDKTDDLGITLTKSAGITAGTYQINGTNNGENYYVIFVKGVYTVKPKQVNIIIANKSSVYGESIKELNCDLHGSSTLAYDESLDDLDIVLTKESGTSARRYAITGVCGNENYNATFIIGEYTISKRTVMVNFLNYSELVYNGKIQTINCLLLGSLLLNDEANISLRYNKTPKNAGTYIATAVIDNSNYAIVGGDVKEFVIAKKPLTIALNNIVVNKGTEPIFTYKYIGFVEGENADDLLEKPSVSSTSDTIGDYELLPAGARSNNYAITFVAGILRINKTEITSLSGVEGSASGSFAPYTTISVASGSDAAFSKIGSIVASTYKITVDGDFYSDTYTLKLNNVALNKYFMRVVMVDDDGIKRSLRSYKYVDGDLILEANCQGSIIVYNDYLPIAVIAVVLLLIIMMVLVYIAKDKKYARNAAAAAQSAIEEADYYRDIKK